MITREELKIWWKKNWKYVVIGVAGGIVGGYAVNKTVNGKLALKSRQLDATITEAEKTISSIRSRVDSTVANVYRTEAKQAFDNKLREYTQSDEFFNVAKQSAKKEVNAAVEKVAKEVFEKYDIEEVMKDYVDSNSLFVKRKIVEAIRDQFDEGFASDVQKAIEGAIEESLR